MDNVCEEHKQKQPKSKIYCSVFGCTSERCKNPELSFHHFPKDGAVQVEYVNELGIKELIDR